MPKWVSYIDSAALWVAANPKTSLAVFVVVAVLCAVVF